MDLFHPLRSVRRHAILAEAMPAVWRAAIEDNVAYTSLLTDPEKAILYDDARVFVAEKLWEGGEGYTVTDEIKITIAAQACILLLGMEAAHREELFPNVTTVIVYASGFRTRRTQRTGYLASDENVSLLGEAWSANLPVVISWQHALQGARRDDDGHNVVLHEFAHKLDALGGGASGVPPLATQAEVDAWADVMSEEFRLLSRAAEDDDASLLDHYGATNEAEFFAVATEAFFEHAVRMRDEKPRLYATLLGYYRQDTAARAERMRA